MINIEGFDKFTYTRRHMMAFLVPIIHLTCTPSLCHLSCPMTSDNNRGYQVDYTQVPFPAWLCVYCELNSHSAADLFKQLLVIFYCNVGTLPVYIAITPEVYILTTMASMCTWHVHFYIWVSWCVTCLQTTAQVHVMSACYSPQYI